MRLSRAERRRRRPPRGAVREPSAVGRARREKPRDGGDADRRAATSAASAIKPRRRAARSGSRPTRPTTKAAQALAEDRPADAERSAQQARAARCPAKAHFHALLGDIDLQQNAATTTRFEHYGDAIDRNDDFFYYHLQKGLAHRQLRQWDDVARRARNERPAAADRRRVLRARHDRRAARRSRKRARALRSSAARRRAPPARPRRTRRFGSTCRRIPASTSRRAAGSTSAAS